MNQTVKNFFEREKEGDVRLEVLANGVRYLSNQCVKFNRLHESYKPLTDEQIDVLQNEVSSAQMSAFVFPKWYKDFLKTTNGCNLYFDCLSLYGEQTPVVWSEEEKTYVKALFERTNSNWMAPYDLRFTNSIKFDNDSKRRWLTIGVYGYDGTQVAWDYKIEKIVAMYRLPITLSVKARRLLKEHDYEKLICQQWTSFDEFFMRETKRLNDVLSKYGIDKEKGFIHGEKTLPIGHKDYQD